MNHRREIDGLRAVAVLSVIAYHAGFHEFSGGFVGVDVFFVISGYLITSILLAENATGSFSIVGFYERRARRILPALFVVMLACLPFAWLWLMPAALKDFSASLVAVSLFASNVQFWRTSDYFTLAADLKPLLHTWSLGVEEQYYIFFPLFVSLMWRFGRRFIAAALVTAAAVSLVAAQWGVVHAPTPTFYLLPTRAWELLVGALLAFSPAPVATTGRWRVAGEAGALLGSALMLYGIFGFDRDTPFPGINALVPALGAALVILCASEGTFVGGLLSTQAFVGVGLISYSAYLWHQPLFAFARERSLDAPSVEVLGGLALLSFVLAYFSWRYVEIPFRSRSRVTRAGIFKLGAAGTAFFTAVGLVGYACNGFDYRLTPEQRSIVAFGDYDYSALYRLHTCFLEGADTLQKFTLECGQARNSAQMLMVWGDSYAAAMTAGLRAMHPAVAQYTASGCPPLVDTRIAGRPNCMDVNNFVKSRVAHLKPAWIFLEANWKAYRLDASAVNVDKTLKYIHAVSPASRVVVVGNVPKWEPSLPIYAVRRGLTLKGEQYLFDPAYDSLRQLDTQIAAVALRNGAQFVSALDVFCRGQVCLAVVGTPSGSELTEWDNGHLTLAGSTYLAHRLPQVLALPAPVAASGTDATH